MTVFYESDSVTLHLGDCLDVLATLPDSSVDAVICDPPYGLADHHPRVIAETLAAWLAGDRAHIPAGAGFMNAPWDRFVPPPAVWDECLRVLKPGGHLAAFAAPRTADLMTLSIRLAGFEIRDSFMWVTAQGMPKGQNIGKAIDRQRNDRPEVLQVTAFLAAARATAGLSHKQIDEAFGFNGMASHWTAVASKAASVPTMEQWARLRDMFGFDDAEILPLVEKLNDRKGDLGEAWAQREVVGHRHSGLSHGSTSVFLNGTAQYENDMVPVTAPATDTARQWHGWNTQLRPAYEPIILARKTTGFNTIVANVLEHGTGAINIDACRTEAGQDYREKCASVVGIGSPRNGDTLGEWTGVREDSAHVVGRWPTNVLLSHPPLLGEAGDVIGDACAEGCVPGCPVAEMDRQSGVGRTNRPSSRGAGGQHGTYSAIGAQADLPYYADEGGASRFFSVFRFEAKASKSERPRLADGTAHSTVKPLSIMTWIARLLTPPGGLILDPFAGSGTTLEAAVTEGFRAVGVELQPEYAALCVQRLSKPIKTALFGLDTDGGAL